MSRVSIDRLPRSPFRFPVLLTLPLCIACAGFAGTDGGLQTQAFRIAFSANMIAQINESDAKAAIRAWSRAVLSAGSIAAEAVPVIVNGNDMAAAFLSNQVDFATMTTPEYFTLSSQAPTAHLIVGSTEGLVGDEYVLVVRQDRGIRSLEDAKGAKVGIYSHHSTALAEDWLKVILARKGLAAPESFFAETSRKQKLASVVLPVFFGASDACVVTRRGLDTMFELNPQLGKTLRVLEKSPRYVASLFCFSGTFDKQSTRTLVSALLELHKTPSGQQILTVFQTGKLEEHNEETLRTARDLLEERRTLDARLISRSQL